MTQHHEVKAKSAENSLCFFIAPIGDPDTDVRKRSDQVLKHVVRPAALAWAGGPGPTALYQVEGAPGPSHLGTGDESHTSLTCPSR